jgi:hypothetical protein
VTSASQALDAMIGTKCWTATLVNGEMLQLECGDRRTEIGVRGRPIDFGAIGMILETLAWSITQGDTVTAATDEAVWERLSDLESTVENFELAGDRGIGISIRFSSGSSLVIDESNRTRRGLCFSQMAERFSRVAALS